MAKCDMCSKTLSDKTTKIDVEVWNENKKMCLCVSCCMDYWSGEGLGDIKDCACRENSDLKQNKGEKNELKEPT